MPLPQFLNDATGRMLRSAAPGSKRIRVMKLTTDLTVHAYRRSGGRLGGTWFGAPVALLDHVGRRTGKRRTTPVLYLRDGDDLVIVASRGGSAKSPAWWLNLRDGPATTIQIGRELRSVHAREADATEKERLWPQLVALYPDFTEYRSRTDRDIPVIVLEHTGS